MAELPVAPTPEVGPRFLPDQVIRQLLLVRGRSGLLTEDFTPSVVTNQAQFDRNTDDYVAMVGAHQNTNVGLDARILGVHEETRKTCIVVVDGQETEFVEATPQARNIWVGERAQLMTAEQAEKTPHGGQTALKWATVRGEAPEMVVRASDGYFYPATQNDIVMSDKR